MSGSLPDGACDAHCHIFGPRNRFPYDAARSYTPEDAPKEALFARHRQLGIDRAVIVQPNCHGFDHSATLDAIAASCGRYRGVALLQDDVRQEVIATLHKGGIRGARLNFVPRLGGPPTKEVFKRLADLIAPYGWHLVLHVTPEDLPVVESYVRDVKIAYVIDHMARINAKAGLQQEAFKRLLDMIANPSCWIKTSGADRVSSVGAPFADVAPFMSALIAAAPQRVLWGSDWPHPNIQGPIPNEEDLLNVLKRETDAQAGWLTSILKDNPDVLYGFSEIRSA